MIEGFIRRGDIYYPAAEVEAEGDDYRAIWNQEADDDAVYSATGVVSDGREDYATLTATKQRLWREFPRRHFGTILEIGCGYGRVPMLLSRERGVTCDTYIGVDIARNMLTRFALYRTALGVFPEAEVRLVCASAEQVPFAADSVDLVVSSGVFLHMSTASVRSTLACIGRLLRPGGTVVFDTSFPNARSIASVPARIYGLLAPAKPNRAKYYSRGQLDLLMRESGIAAKCGAYQIEPTDFAVLPSRIRRVKLPLLAQLNQLLTPPPRALENVLAMMYSVHSKIA